MTGHIPSYSSIYAIGHKAAAALFDGPVVVEEKVDGSQFSFGIDEDGELMCRSKGKDLVVDAPEKMFQRAVDNALEIATELHPGWIYRGEYLEKPKHNALAYGRVPARHVILYDIDTGLQEYLDVAAKRTEAGRIGLEIVPVMFEGVITSADQVRALLHAESCLGGVAPEGLVVKNYAQFGSDKKVLMGKYVTEAFKESYKAAWGEANPAGADIVQRLGATYRTEARWRKAVQHLRERGELTESPKDIGVLLKEVSTDAHRECRDEIADELFAWAWPKIGRQITAGFPQWYKDQLLQQAFVVEEVAVG